MRKNSVFVNFIGLCPALAVTNSLYNAVGMALGTSFVLLAASLMVSLLRKHIPAEVRIPVYIIIIAAFVSVVDILLRAYAPDLSKNLGAFVSLIVVNCLILGQIEMFASKNPPLASLWDAFCTSLGFALALIMIALCRELLARGSITIAGKNLWPDPIIWSPVWWLKGSLKGIFELQLYRGQIITPFSSIFGGRAFFLFALPAGALFVLGYLSAYFRYLEQRHLRVPREWGKKLDKDLDKSLDRKTESRKRGE